MNSHLDKLDCDWCTNLDIADCSDHTLSRELSPSRLFQSAFRPVYKESMEESFNERFTCNICHETSIDPTQYTCKGEHIFCFSCICEYFRHRFSIRPRPPAVVPCPTCRQGNGRVCIISRMSGLGSSLLAARAKAEKDRFPLPPDENRPFITHTSELFAFIPYLTKALRGVFTDKDEETSLFTGYQLAYFANNLDNLRRMRRLEELMQTLEAEGRDFAFLRDNFVRVFDWKDESGAPEHITVQRNSRSGRRLELMGEGPVFSGPDPPTADDMTTMRITPMLQFFSAEEPTPSAPTHRYNLRPREHLPGFIFARDESTGGYSLRPRPLLRRQTNAEQTDEEST